MTLREQIIGELKATAKRVELRIRTGSWDDNTYQDPEDVADRILALIADALLSEQAVEAANSVSVTFHDGEGAVTAALAAAGITTTGEEAGT